MTHPADWANPAVREGMRRMLASRSEALEGGDDPVGWKLGFGAPASLQRFGLSAPLVGFLIGSWVHPPGSRISCEGWEGPVAEPEIAVRIGVDLGLETTDWAGAISGLGPAIELADVHPPPEQVEEVLAGNIFHRAVVFGAIDESRAGGALDGLEAIITCDGIEVARTTDLEAITGRLIEIIGAAARLIAAAGGMIRAGDLIIAGSIVPPLAIEPGQEIGFELAPMPPISVRV